MHLKCMICAVRERSVRFCSLVAAPKWTNLGTLWRIRLWKAVQLQLLVRFQHIFSLKSTVYYCYMYTSLESKKHNIKEEHNNLKNIKVCHINVCQVLVSIASFASGILINSLCELQCWKWKTKQWGYTTVDHSSSIIKAKDPRLHLPLLVYNLQ